MCVVTSRGFFCNMDKQSAQNAQYASGADLLAERSPKPPMRIGRPEMFQAISLCLSSRKASHHYFECSPHAFIMGIGIRLRLTGRNGPEEVVASRTGALEQDLPCALCVWHPRDCLPQSSLLLQPWASSVTNWSEQTGLPMQLDSHDWQLLAQQIVHLANPL